MSSTSKSFLIKDILSENCESTSSDESDDNREVFITKPIDLRRYFKHPLYPIPLRPSSLLLTKSTTTTTPRNTHRINNDVQNSPLDALFEMTKKTFDKSNTSKLLVDFQVLFCTEITIRIKNCNRKKNSVQIFDLSNQRFFLIGYYLFHFSNII